MASETRWFPMPFFIDITAMVAKFTFLLLKIALFVTAMGII
jgi:hypothetical protein